MRKVRDVSMVHEAAIVLVITAHIGNDEDVHDGLTLMPARGSTCPSACNAVGPNAREPETRSPKPWKNARPLINTPPESREDKTGGCEAETGGCGAEIFGHRSMHDRTEIAE